jgi:hypothetical protein
VHLVGFIIRKRIILCAGTNSCLHTEGSQYYHQFKFHCHTNYECALGTLKLKAIYCGAQSYDLSNCRMGKVMYSVTIEISHSDSSGVRGKVLCTGVLGESCAGRQQ